MSGGPRFGYGQVRFLLLDLLERQPRHGYKLLSALGEKFGDDYRPSPGTVYPRLRRMESDGLVRHEVVDGRKIYHLTPAGQRELARHREEAGRPEAEAAGASAAAQAPVGGLSEAIRSDVEDIVRTFRQQFQSALADPGQTSEERDWLSWSGWPAAAASRPRPGARESLQQELDGLTEAARLLLGTGRAPDESLREAAGLLAEAAAALRLLLPPGS
ncbi:DNA-binding PadR family transcriptional regulator [Streptomyces olivoverticillatus]|uniref:DNA-binding PadR family transcriptional regulator n=1 Tax=Streptomyces olivoverticillatus TaxID=66427 RepID=A0A7W7PMB6_9ACTN|nr:PadR family transcriptional regulator [Streptomyces olivoverticillatus]MBB4895174.1 DNA-binding PadR family transcriptional regulator [Streptomyces olivoverticillatus]